MRALLIGLLCLCFALAPATARAELRVAVTIKPIHALTAGVLGKIATPYLIVKGAATPHSYALKPSDATALQKADVVIRIGGTMERFLDSAIKTISPDATVISLIDIDGITRLPFRQGVAWGTGDDHDHDHGHNHSQRPEPHTTTPQNASDSASHQAALPVDPHIWLAPDNAIRMVATIVSALSRAAPDHAAVFASNGAILTDRLRALAAEIATKTAPVGDRRFLVFHDGG